jgi:hypothetical protein
MNVVITPMAVDVMLFLLTVLHSAPTLMAHMTAAVQLDTSLILMMKLALVRTRELSLL